MLPVVVAVVVGIVGLPQPQEVAARYAGAVVVVERATARGPQRSHGFFVSSAGLVCTVLPGAREGDAVVVSGGEREAAVVRVVDDDGLALVAVTAPPAPGHERAALGVARAAAAPSSSSSSSSLSSSLQPAGAPRWWVGLVRDEGGVRGVAGEVVEERGDRWRLLLPVPRGAPILDERNDVVAVATASHGAGAIDAVPAARLRALAARLAVPGPPR